jgi:hypothetical protein
MRHAQTSKLPDIRETLARDFRRPASHPEIEDFAGKRNLSGKPL